MALARFVNILVGRAYEIDKFDISEFLFVVPAFALFALLIVTLASLSVTEATSEIISLPNAPISWIEYGIAIGLIILVGVSAVWYFYSRRVPIHKIWGRSMCLFSFVWFLSAVVFAVSWYLDVYFIGQFFEGEENPVLAIHLFVFSIYKMLIYGYLDLLFGFGGGGVFCRFFYLCLFCPLLLELSRGQIVTTYQ